MNVHFYYVLLILYVTKRALSSFYLLVKLLSPIYMVRIVPALCEMEHHFVFAFLNIIKNDSLFVAELSQHFGLSAVYLSLFLFLSLYFFLLIPKLSP